MCTVTFTPTKRGSYLTSNRDEHAARAKVVTLKKYPSEVGVEFIFPQDPDAGGSWIAIKNIDGAAVLLNGASFKHIPKPPYIKSRGLVLIDVVGSAEHFRTLSIHKAYIWSTATLYKSKAKVKREAWFNDWVKSNGNPIQMYIVSCHRYTGDGDRETGLMVNRADEIATISITSLGLSVKYSDQQYVDLVNHASSKEFLALTTATQMEALAHAS